MSGKIYCNYHRRFKRSKAAVDTAVTTYEDKCIDSFVLGNPHESIFPAIYGTTQVEEISALGILETYDAASIIERQIRQLRQLSLI